MFTEIRQKKLSEVVADQIKAAITDGKLKPGDKLAGERKIAEQLGVSRPPVRDALKQLIFSGFLEIKGNATFVKSLTGSLLPDPLREHIIQSGQAFYELAEVRMVLEGWAAFKAAVNRTAAQLDHLKEIVEAMEDPNLDDITTTLDLDFHRTVAEMVGNTIFLHQITSIAKIVIPIVTQYREQIFIAPHEKELLLDHHRQIYLAIRDKNPEKAKKAMETHIEYTKRVSHAIKEIQ